MDRGLGMRDGRCWIFQIQISHLIEHSTYPQTGESFILFVLIFANVYR